MEATVWRFLLFLGSELGFLIASFAAAYVIGLLILKDKAIKNSYFVVSGILFELVTIVFLFLFMWTLTGQTYLPLFVVLAVVSITLILVSELAWLIVGTSNVPWGAQLLWAQYEFQQTVPTANKVLQIVGAIAILVVYPAYIGYGYFGDTFASPEWARYVLRATLVVVVGVAWATSLPKRLYLMVSRNISEDIRSRLFISQLGPSMSVLLLVSLFIWTIGGTGTTAEVLGEYFVFSPIVAYVVGVYLVAVLIVPYLIGHSRWKRWVAQLASECQDIIEELSRGLLSPNPVRGSEALTKAKQAIRNAYDKLDEDGSLTMATQMEKSTSIENVAQRLALKESKRHDLRYVHAQHLADLQQTTEDCEAQLAQKMNEKDKREILVGYMKLLEYVNLLQKQKEPGAAGAGAQPLVLVGLATLAGAMLTPIVASVGKFIIGKMGIGE